VFILFDAQCVKCNRPFKAEADCGSALPAEGGEYRYTCVRCHTVTTVRGDQGAVTAATIGWAVPAIQVIAAG
jgi:hypothetical protein